MNRRDFLSVGGLSLSALGLPNLLAGENKSSKSVILLYLSGGMSHAESFTAKPDSVDKYRSVTGYVKTKDGFYLGGGWDKMSGISDKYSVVHSFNHQNSGHQGGTHYVMTGYNFNNENQGAAQNHPSYGSIVSKQMGTNDEVTGMPRYITLNKVYGDGGAFFGSSYNPLSMGDEGKKNLSLSVDEQRFIDRTNVLKALDNRFNKQYNKNIDLYKKQGYDMLLGNVKDAFDISKESVSYGKSTLATQALTARRLIEYGAKFVTISNGGWDMHTDIKKGMESKVPEVDSVLHSLITDLENRGMIDNTLIVVATEFGRTPINANAGRDHWSRNTPLMLAGGKYQGLGVIGSVDKNGFEVTDKPYYPIDLLKSILIHMDLDINMQTVDLSGRPRYILEGTANVIR